MSKYLKIQQQITKKITMNNKLEAKRYLGILGTCPEIVAKKIEKE